MNIKSVGILVNTTNTAHRCC